MSVKQDSPIALELKRIDTEKRPLAYYKKIAREYFYNTSENSIDAGEEKVLARMADLRGTEALSLEEAVLKARTEFEKGALHQSKDDQQTPEQLLKEVIENGRNAAIKKGARSAESFLYGNTVIESTPVNSTLAHIIENLSSNDPAKMPFDTKPVVGSPGTSRLMEQMIEKELAAGHKVIIVDPKGESKAKFAAAEGYKDISSYVNPSFKFELEPVALSTESLGGQNNEVKGANNHMTEEDLLSVSAIVTQMVFYTGEDNPPRPTEEEVAIINGACQWAYELHGREAKVNHVAEYLRTYPKHTNIPTSPELIKIAHRMAVPLADFTKPGPYGKFFRDNSYSEPLKSFTVTLPKPDSPAAVEQIKAEVKKFRSVLPSESRKSLAQTYQLVAKALGFKTWEALIAFAERQGKANAPAPVNGEPADRAKHIAGIISSISSAEPEVRALLMKQPDYDERALKMRVHVAESVAGKIMGWHVDQDDNLQLWRDKSGKIQSRVTPDNKTLKLCRYSEQQVLKGYEAFNPSQNRQHLEIVLNTLKSKGLICEQEGDNIVLEYRGELERVMPCTPTEYAPHWTQEFLVCGILLKWLVPLNPVEQLKQKWREDPDAFVLEDAEGFGSYREELRDYRKHHYLAELEFLTAAFSSKLSFRSGMQKKADLLRAYIVQEFGESAFEK